MKCSQELFTVFQKTEISEPALFSPSDTTKQIENFPEICVSTFSENIIQKFSSLDTTEKIAELYSANGVIPVYKIRYKNTDIAFYLSRVGAPACVVGFEEIIAMGAKKFVLFGSCGVLEDIPENRFLIPVSALRDEGTSYHYLPPSREVEISKAGINAIESALSQKNIPYWEVKTWTTDGFYRETVEMVQYRKEEGCQVVEMECSALAACAKFRKVTWAMLLFPADTLADPHKYQEREWGKTSISIALELALDAVLSVVEE